MASSSRSIFENCTNIQEERRNPWSFLSSAAQHKRPAGSNGDGVSRKRVKLAEKTIDEDSDSNDSEAESEEDSEICNIRRRRTIFGLLNATGPRRIKQPYLSTRFILNSFVSSNKADVFKCTSMESDYEYSLVPPYACAHTHDSKRGGTPILAVATEQGSVHILNTSKRRGWEFEPPRTILRPHSNGVFDVKWNDSDTLIATVSGDCSARISCPTTERTIYTLKGHTGTVKCVAWDPSHRDLLCTGGRDGEIRVWDLRTAKQGVEDETDAAIVVPGAHEQMGTNKGRKGKKAPARAVTNLLYPDDGRSQGVISTGSFNSVLRYWDFRFPSSSNKRSPKPKATLLHSSESDPTTTHSSRPRGIISISAGTGPTAGLLFAFSADSQIHTYSLSSLRPLVTPASTFSHKNMQVNSFYVNVATSPCGRWLASGSTGPNGSAFLYDVSNAALSRTGLESIGIEFRGQKGEVGGLDWADGALATCAEDGTVRVWRPDLDVYKECVRNPEEKSWDWSWAVER